MPFPKNTRQRPWQTPLPQFLKVTAFVRTVCSNCFSKKLFSKETQNPVLHFRIQAWIFLKKRTLNLRTILKGLPPTKGSFTIWLGGRMISPPLLSVKTEIELSRLSEIESCTYISELNRFSLRWSSTRAFLGVVKYKCIIYVVFGTSYLKKTNIRLKCMWYEKFFLLIWKAFWNTEGWPFSFWNIVFLFRDIDSFYYAN